MEKEFNKIIFLHFHKVNQPECGEDERKEKAKGNKRKMLFLLLIAAVWYANKDCDTKKIFSTAIFLSSPPVDITNRAN